MDDSELDKTLNRLEEERDTARGERDDQHTETRRLITSLEDCHAAHGKRIDTLEGCVERLEHEDEQRKP